MTITVGECDQKVVAAPPGIAILHSHSIDQCEETK
jgi:hypothetical protein